MAALSMVLAPVSGADPVRQKLDETSQGAPYASGELIVIYKPGAPRRAVEASDDKVAAKTKEKVPEIRTRLLTFPKIKDEKVREVREKALERRKQALERDPTVEAVEYNYLSKPVAAPNDPSFDKQWGLEKIEAPRAWEEARGEGARVAVVDSGIDQNHPDFRGQVAAQKDFINNDPVAEDQNPYSHGTHVAGTVAAVTDNGAGVASTCPDCQLLVAKVYKDRALDFDVADGIVWSADNGAEAINLSLGKPSESRFLKTAIDYASNRGSLVVAAAGNSNNRVKNYPAAYPNVIAVSATNRADEKAGFSTFGDWVDVAAPGDGILSTVRGGYGYSSGTSMASPHVAGLAGILAGEGLPASKIRQRIESTAVDLGPRGKDPYYGHGRINARSALGIPRGPQTSKPALYRSGTFYLKNTLSGGPADNAFDYGGTRRGTTPLMGDWNADGKKTAGVYRSGTFYLKNSNRGGKADSIFSYGKAGDKPVVGDWNGDGRDTVGIVRGGSFYLKNTNRGGRADIRFSYGKADDKPVVGDWDGDGRDSVGIVRGGSFYLKNANRGGRADILFSYGKASDRPVVGDWDGDGKDSVGIVRDGGWYLKNANRGGKADVKFVYSARGATPLVW